ncbi:hypothetical protein PMAYCL1PPCAC_26532, partial [Pristionchus mayeri]
MRPSPVLVVRIICTTEGAIGTILNLALLRALIISRGSSNFRVYRVNIFRDGVFAIPLFGPLVPYFPRIFCDIVEQVGLVFTMNLLREHWRVPKRLAVGFSFTITWFWLVPQFVPTPEFHVKLESIARDLYSVDANASIVMFGSTMRNPELNGGRSMLTLVVFYVFAPYLS